jgi:hypothetical protein
MENSLNCKVICYSGDTYEIEVDRNKTFSELKEEIKELNESLSDIKLICNGRMVLNESNKISQITSEDTKTLTIYANAAKVHGGCYQKYSN